MNLFGVMNVSASALEAERLRAEVVASNMANADTTRTPQGGPYKRHEVVFESEAPDQSVFGQNGFAHQLFSQASLDNLKGMNSVSGGDNLDGGIGSTAANGGLLNGGVFNGNDEGAGIGGVKIAAVVEDNSPGIRRYDPSNPDADKQGYVTYPDINPLTEMVNLMSAERAYDMNTSAVEAAKSMIATSIDILK